jgi:hypothetical protein
MSSKLKKKWVIKKDNLKVKIKVKIKSDAPVPQKAYGK